MLGFGSAQAAGLSELIAKKRYPKAIEVLREQLKGRRRDPRVRRQLADVLAIDLEKAGWSKLRKNEAKYPVELARGRARKYTDLADEAEKP